MIVKAPRTPLLLLLSLTLLTLAALMGFTARTPGWTAADMNVSQAIQATRTPWLTVVAQVLNVGFGTLVGAALVAALTGALAISGRPRAAGRTLVVIAAGWGVSLLFKTVIARPRPPAAHFLLVQELGKDSFPSGHVCLTLSIVIALALLAGGSAYFLPVVVAGCLLVAAQMLARVYLGAHYPTDTVGSIMVTPAAIYLVTTVKRLPALGVLLLQADNRRRARRAAPPDTRKIKILLLHAYGMGGTIRTVFNIAGTLAADHDVEIVSVVRTKEHPFFPVPPGVRVTFLDDRRHRRPTRFPRLAPLRRSRLIPREEAAYATFNLRTDLKLLRFLRGLRTGVLITTRPGLNLAAALLAPPGVITIGQEHVGFASHQPPLRKMIARRYGRLDAVVTLTEADLQAYRTALGTRAPHHLLRIPNALSPLTGGPSPLTAKTVLAIGRLTKVKGFDLLIRAWEQVQAANPGWTLRILGAGPQRARLEAAVEKRGLTGSVELPGARSDIGAELDDASVFALSSRHEGFSMTILEALSKGVPVASFDCPHGPREILTHEHDGLLVPRRDVDALAATISHLIGDEASRRRIGAEGLHTSRRYDPAAIGDRWRVLLADLETDRQSGSAGR
ncbi:glycosyltransferase [Sphaerisporangium perillae]|uniref:glycosyltransferase n=1 Tax=Sphaerisporangium perillae TaxID=2935860 RepID=UPI00200D869F|nr:glycosyltransferase [Sphaerisporangium perillae]